MALLVRAIRPTAFQPKAIEDAVRKAQREWLVKVTQEFLKTTRNWKHRVAFAGKMAAKGIAATMEVGTADDIYRYVDEGTGLYGPSKRKYPIRPKRAKALAFPSVSAPKTRPGSLVSGAGSKGGKTVFAKEVRHPGIKARDFTGQIEKKMRKVLEKDLQAAMNRGAGRSGHGA